jgi:SAM-dependent methyltransferase
VTKEETFVRPAGVRLGRRLPAIFGTLCAAVTIALEAVEAWRRSWDRQQAAHEHGREQRFDTMLEYVEFLAGPPGRVLDLGCGTGSITERVLARFPATRVAAVDVDPILLALAAAAFADDDRVEVFDRDLRDAGWATGLAGAFDAVLTATALHWLDERTLERLYRELATLVRAGGVFANADHMPIDNAQFAEAAERANVAHEQRAFAAGVDSYDEWYARIGADHRFARLAAERERRFAGWSGDHLRPAAWHAERLRAAGFSAVEVVWRWGNDAILVAVR